MNTLGGFPEPSSPKRITKLFDKQVMIRMYLFEIVNYLNVFERWQLTQAL